VTVNAARGDRANGDDIARHLARHGIAVEISDIVTDREGNVGDVLLSRVTDEAADLIVMGAYGHSRLRELVLGGVSRHSASLPSDCEAAANDALASSRSCAILACASSSIAVGNWSAMNGETARVGMT